MENMTKALLIAGAIFIAVMLLSVIVFFFDDIAAYFSVQHESTMLEQLVDFNKDFANYDGKTIRGNELVSIMNRIVDYNNYQSGIVGYFPIAIEINFFDNKYVDELKYGGETGGSTLINSQKITNNNGNDDTYIKRIAETSARLVSLSGIPRITDVKLQKLSSEISNIVDDESAVDKDAYKATRAQKLKRILGTDAYNINDVEKATYQYYQYTQFKRAMFKCKSITYNETNGRVNRMEFEVVLEDNLAGGKQIKFD